MLDYWCEYNDAGITVPYAPYRGQGQSNRGFTDLRGRPDLAAQVAEAQDSSAFKALIIQLAQPYSQLFSVGCDLGTRAANRGAARYMAGGYPVLAVFLLARITFLLGIDKSCAPPVGMVIFLQQPQGEIRGGG